MCGRYKRPGKQKIAEAFAVSEGLEAFDLEPDDNACPQSFQPVIHLNGNGERQMGLMRWAFRLSDKLLFNARSEGIEQAKFWSDSFQKRRCIIPASAIQESQDLPDGKKGDKYQFDIPGREVFGMAGVWELWKHPKTGQWESTFAVLTGEPNEVMQPIHNRLATVLEPRDYAEYLAFSERPPIHLLRILPSNELRATRLEKPSPKSRSKSIEDTQICLFGSERTRMPNRMRSGLRLMPWRCRQTRTISFARNSHVFKTVFRPLGLLRIAGDPGRIRTASVNWLMTA